MQTNHLKKMIGWVVLLTLFSLPESVFSHESQPGVLNLEEFGPSQYRITWKAPIYYGRPHPAQLKLPGSWKVVGEPTLRRYPNYILHHQMVKTGGETINGQIIRFSGLESTITDVFIRVKRTDGSQMTAVARPTKPWAELRGKRPWHKTALEYILLGFSHIMIGYDHLLFVLGLLLIVRHRMMLVKTITSFTIAHSITLGIATLGYSTAPLLPLNAAIALSILFLGPEIIKVKKGGTSLTTRYPWIIAFGFGLLHGFGFASGLTTTGMPAAEIPWALLWFNIGVESGQLSFVFLIFALMWSFNIFQFTWPRWSKVLPGYVVGSFGAYWTLQRTLILFLGP